MGDQGSCSQNDGKQLGLSAPPAPYARARAYMYVARKHEQCSRDANNAVLVTMIDTDAMLVTVRTDYEQPSIEVLARSASKPCGSQLQCRASLVRTYRP